MYFGGDVYSSVDPFATALGVGDGLVSFIGSDEAALALDPRALNLGGDFLTPGFVHSGLVLTGSEPTAAQLHERGFTHIHVLGDRDAVAEFRTGAPDSLHIVDYPHSADGRLDEDATRPPRISLTATELEALNDLPEASVFVRVDSNNQLESALERLASDAAHAHRFGYRLLTDFPIAESLIPALGRSGIAVSMNPQQPQFLAELLAQGAQVSWTYGEDSPWESVRAAVLAEHGISARAAFNAATRFAHRAAGDPEGGVLAPGKRADIVRWKVDRLVVQVADPRVAEWSTDPRSGTPGLPEMAPDIPLPRRIELISGNQV